MGEVDLFYLFVYFFSLDLEYYLYLLLDLMQPFTF